MVLIRLSGWSPFAVSLLFAFGKNRISHNQTPHSVHIFQLLHLSQRRFLLSGKVKVFPGHACGRFTETQQKISELQSYPFIWDFGWVMILSLCSIFTSSFSLFLAHLSQRLIGELIGYSWSGVCPSSVGPSDINNFKHLLLQNR